MDFGSELRIALDGLTQRADESLVDMHTGATDMIVPAWRARLIAQHVDAGHLRTGHHEARVASGPKGVTDLRVEAHHRTQHAAKEGLGLRLYAGRTSGGGAHVERWRVHGFAGVSNRMANGRSSY